MLDSYTINILKKHGHIIRSDNTLHGFTKARIVQMVRCLENNWAAALERCENQYKTLCVYHEKEKKYGWHDLRNNPDDLPEQAGHKVRICIEGITLFNEKQKNYCDAFIGYGDLSWYTCDHEMMRRASNICDNRISECYKVIAWREIEPFEP